MDHAYACIAINSKFIVNKKTKKQNGAYSTQYLKDVFFNSRESKEEKSKKF